MASSSSRSLPAASSSALLSASFPGPGLWRRRRTLVGRDVVVGLACQAIGARRNLLLQGYRLQIVFSFELGSVDAANLCIVAMLCQNQLFHGRGC
jgi:hypothetical protein